MSTATTLPRRSELARHWSLRSDRVFLNHGSFGACPLEVLAAQSRIRALMEEEPVRFFVELFTPMMDQVRAELAAFVRCRSQDLALVPNATIGVATVLAAAESWLKPGDEILVNDHEYTSCRNNVNRLAARTGASVVSASIPFPVSGPEPILNAILSRVTSRTRLALVSHVTSPSGMILPIAPIVRELEGRGIVTCVDGAHAPGQIPDLDIASLGASFYAANCHKWVCSPKGSAFLWVRPDRQESTRPVVLSNFAEKPRPGRSQFLTEFDYIGTQDFSSLLTIPDALKVMGAIVPGGWRDVMRRNHEQVVRGRDVVCRAIGVEHPIPASMLGSLSTIVLPELPADLAARLAARPTLHHDALQDALVARGIQVPVWTAGGKRVLRISAQLYNSQAEYEYLAGVLAEELAKERRAG